MSNTINNSTAPEREQDILKLCEAVLSMSPNRWHNPNGADESSCPICHNIEYGLNWDLKEMEHEKNCAYLIAKDLSTGLI